MVGRFFGHETSEEINSFLKSDITDDEIFGYMTRYHMDCYFDEKKIAELREKVAGISAGVVIVYGVGAAYVMPESDVLVICRYGSLGNTDAFSEISCMVADSSSVKAERSDTLLLLV